MAEAATVGAFEGTKPAGSDAARELHRSHPAVDWHVDSLLWSRWLGYDLCARHEPPLPRAAFAGHFDVPRAIEGGIGAVFLGLVSLPFARRGCARAVEEQIDLLDAFVAAGRGRIRKARSAEDVDAARAAGAVAALLGIEGAHALEGDADRLDAFARRGVRYLGLLHFSANEAGFPAWGLGRRDGEGLTRWGRDLVARCEALGVIVDLAHLNRRGFLDACAIAKRPVVVSHTGVAGTFDHWRNVDDAQLRAVARTGGLAGVIFCPNYLGGPDVDAVVRHVEHVVDVAGEDAVAIGSDWDGMIVPTRGLEDASRLPALTDALLGRGWKEGRIRKILRGNAMRVLRDAPARDVAAAR